MIEEGVKKLNILDIDFEILDAVYVSKKAEYYGRFGEYVPKTIEEEIRRFRKRG